MNIFITGVAGFLGSHLADRMLELGHNVFGVDNLIGGELENIPHGVEFIQADCGDFNKMKLLTKNMDIIYHTACTAYEGLSVFSPSLVTQNTYQNTVALLSAGITNNIKRFVHCSSMARYGTQEVIPFTEDMICKPQDPYGIAKYSSELVVSNLCNTHGIEYSIAVPHNIIGPRQKYDDPFRNVASIMINLMLQGRSPTIYGDGEQMRCFSFVQDDIQCLEKMAFQDNVIGEVINIGPDNRFITINQLYTILSDMIGFEGEPIHIEDRPNEVKKAVCSADKARKLLDYKTTTDLENGLDSMIKFIKDKGVKNFVYHLPLEIESELTPKTWTKKLF